MPQHLRIALLIESSRGFGRKLLLGIARYARRHGPWILFHEDRHLDSPLPKDLAKWRPDGVVARLGRRAAYRQLCKLGLPTVNLGRAQDCAGHPLLADRQRGGRGPGGGALPGTRIPPLRLLRAARRALFRIANQELPTDSLPAWLARAKSSVGGSPVMPTWPRSRPTPSGAPASWPNGSAGCPSRWPCWHAATLRAQHVMAVCDQAGIAVPGEVAVLGVGNDELDCELCNPSLSSVDLDTERIGYEAAALLDRMIRGEPPPAGMLTIPPRGVVTRRSTDALAIADRDVAEAVQLRPRTRLRSGNRVRGHPRPPGRFPVDVGPLVPQMAGANGQRGDRPRCGLEKAKDLLATTDLPLEEIAARCGFRPRDVDVPHGEAGHGADARRVAEGQRQVAAQECSTTSAGGWRGGPGPSRSRMTTSVNHFANRCN